DGADLDRGAKLRYGRENRRAFGTVGHSVGGVLHIATREDFAVREKDGGPYPELRVRRVCILHDPFCGFQKSCRRVSRQCFLTHKGSVSWRMAKSRAIVNPGRTIDRFFLRPS